VNRPYIHHDIFERVLPFEYGQLATCVSALRPSLKHIPNARGSIERPYISHVVSLRSDLAQKQVSSAKLL